MNGKMIEFAANGSTAGGYLAVPENGNGIGVIVLQEWWGLVPHIKDVADRFAAAGFTALAPDLYDGISTASPDEAGKLFMALNIAETDKKLRGAIDYLLANNAVTHEKAGTIGFCMGGMLSLYAANFNENVGACVSFYGIHPAVKLDFEKFDAPVLGLYAENDKSVPPSAVAELEANLLKYDKTCEFKIYDDAEHAFFNDTRPEVYRADYAADAWEKVLNFFRESL